MFVRTVKCCKEIMRSQSINVNNKMFIVFFATIGSPFLIASDCISLVCYVEFHNKLNNLDLSASSSRDN